MTERMVYVDIPHDEPEANQPCRFCGPDWEAAAISHVYGGRWCWRERHRSGCPWYIAWTADFYGSLNDLLALPAGPSK